jgi:hypothetical protein
MAMVRVRPVRVGVAKLGVPVLVRMRPLDAHVARVVVIVMGIVGVTMCVDDVRVSVRMLMTLASEEPGGAEDEGHGGVRRHRRRLAKDRQRHPGREERRRAEQGPRARRTQLSQRANEERDARPIARCAEGERRQRETYRRQTTPERDGEEKRERARPHPLRITMVFGSRSET